jgi:GTPase
MQRKRTDLEVKFDNFMSNHWLHMVKEVANLQGQMKILIGLVSGLAAFVVGVWALEVLR